MGTRSISAMQSKCEQDDEVDPLARQYKSLLISHVFGIIVLPPIMFGLIRVSSFKVKMGQPAFEAAKSLRTLILLLVSILCVVIASEDPQVTTTSGTYQGSELASPNDDSYFAFLGIPFAEPPIGDLRFRKPIPKAKIEDVYDATEYKPHCLQFNVINQEFPLGEEDCLYLNVFTPAEASAATGGDLKKVFVYLHGGGNMNGFPELYEPGSLVVQEDIIVVTTSYRLAFLGFLTTQSPAAPGNLGLWDQVQALRWVKDNILAFGGDPHAITLGGESAGAIDTAALSYSSVAGDLFNQAISMSGVLSPGPFSMTTQNPTRVTFQIGRREKCLSDEQEDPKTEKDLEQLIDCLRKVPAVNLISPEGLDPIPQIGLVIDGDLLPKELAELNSDKAYMETIKFNKKKFLIGFNYNEGAVFEVIYDTILYKMPVEQRRAMPPDAMFLGSVPTFLSGVYGPVSQSVVEKVVEYYTNHHQVSLTADFTADVVFHMPTLEYVNATSAAFPPGESQVYMFRFVTFPRFLTGRVQGIPHGMDQIYLFDVDFELVNKVIDYGVDPKKWNEEDDEIKRKYCALVGAFVKTGDPGLSLSADLPDGWPAFDQDSGQFLVFNLSPYVDSHFLPDRVRLWKEQIPAWIQQFPLEAGHKQRDEL